jgi:hypothetical protein
MIKKTQNARFQVYATTLVAGVVMGIVTLPFAGFAEAAPDPTGPVIYLADNLDEADGLGWCIDTLGRGFSETLQTHSCKPQGGDTQFRYDAEVQQIQSVAFEGKCMALSDPDNTAVPFGLINCVAGDQTQQFGLNADTGRITLATDATRCVVAGANSRTAGPFMSRDLTIAPCEGADPALATWNYKP